MIIDESGVMRCGLCGGEMKRVSPDEYMFECENCGDRSNEVTDDYYDGRYDEAYDTPECCEACGGNYPYCADSCSILDD